ncbi:hypothetical protein PspLS_10596 [Pyricularia sp. CBS 133598]|nr:hypothetical protein PspLS_10596 [Pyricularia sp. CBS 133598]
MEKYSSAEPLHQRLLNQDASDDGESSSSNFGFGMPQPKSVRSRLRDNITGFVSCLLLFYIAVISTMNLATKSSSGNSSHHTGQESLSSMYPALPDLHIEYQKRVEWVDPRPHPFNLPVSDALDTAWEDLLYSLNVRVRPHEMNLINETMVNRARVTGDGYAAAMGIWHELHCLNNLRKLLHWDYYGPKYGGKENPEAFGKGHSDHCIDMIRQSLMCRPDTSLYPFHWGPDGIPSNHVKAKTPKTCVRWDSLENWAQKRALRPGEYSYVREHSAHQHAKIKGEEKKPASS